MKKITSLSIILLTCFNLYSQISRISFPLDKSVFQRDGDLTTSTANIVFTGYLEETSSSSTDSEFWVTRLDKSGGSLGYYISPTTINPGFTARVGVSNVHVYRIVRDIPTGWYSFSLKNGKDNSVTTIKFGVGEVFVIAGQSNAQGFGKLAFNSGTVTNSYECVLSLKNNLMYWNDDNDFYTLDVPIENIPMPIHGTLNSSNPKIGPMGGRPWFFQKLGEQIANMHGDSPVVPVVFYNTALSGSTITNWYGAMKTAEKLFSSNYSNSLNPSSTLGYPNASYPNSTGWHVGSFDSNAYERLFLNLKNVLSFYGNMFGVRAVLWHQGESETKTLLTQTSSGVYSAEGTVPSGYNIGTYGSKLLEIIDETREILPGLGWAISKVSLTSELRLSDNTRLYNIINPTGQLVSSPAISGHALGATSVTGSVLSEQANLQSGYSSKVKWFTQNSDNYPHSTSSSKRQNDDYVHFSITGLDDMAGDAYANRTSYLALSPVLNTPPPLPVITRISAGYYNIDMLPSVSGMSYVHKQWSSSYYFEDYVQTATNNSSSVNGSYLRGGFTKDNLGRIHIMPRIDYGLPSARAAANYSSTVYPNPLRAGSVVDFYIEDESEIIKFEYFTENGDILASKTVDGLPIGRHTELIPIEKMKNEKIVYVHISKTKREKKEAIRLKVN